MLEKLLHPLTDFVDQKDLTDSTIVTYYYEGKCPKTGKNLKLPRTVLAEKIATNLCHQLNQNNWHSDKGKMLGVLIVEDQFHQQFVIKAFSGYLQSKKEVEGWVKPVSGYSMITIAEKLTLKKLDRIKEQLISLQNLPAREEYQQLSQQFTGEKKALRNIHRQRKQTRDQIRASLSEDKIPEEIATKKHELEQESRRDDWERRKLKKQWDDRLQLYKQQIEQADLKIKQLKQQRKEISRQLQTQLQVAYTLTNFTGESLSISKLMNRDFFPTGTGDCCAPKLLHHCASNKLMPIAMAEIWWGKTSPNQDKVNGRFYPACVERCQPLMGFLLSGLPQLNQIDRSLSVSMIYEDDYLLAVNKPSGLLSVAGRGIEKSDCVEARLKLLRNITDDDYLGAIHRLDQDTSGILLLAKDRNFHSLMMQQFAQRQVSKVYEAIVMGKVSANEGTIDLPLYSNPSSRPRQEVNYQLGKPSTTYYSVLNTNHNQTRLEFKPITGRTHQLRVHAWKGLNAPIKGDNLYGDYSRYDRLYLHARELNFVHPVTEQPIHLFVDTPF